MRSRNRILSIVYVPHKKCEKINIACNFSTKIAKLISSLKYII